MGKLDSFAGARMDDLESRCTRKALSLFSVVAIIIALGLFTRDTVQSAGTGKCSNRHLHPRHPSSHDSVPSR